MSLTQQPRSFTAKQPARAICMFIAAIHIVARTLFLAIYYIPNFARQNPNWTWRNAVTNEFMRTVSEYIAYFEPAFSLSLEPGPEKDRFVLMKPEVGVYHGVLKSTEFVKPEFVGGTWYPKLYEAEKVQKDVVLHFHGGSFILGTGRADCAAAADILTKNVAPYALFVQYRLSGPPSCAFPAAVQDAVTAYTYVLRKGIPASNIIVSGDSAGGNIAVALLRYITLVKDQTRLPNPKGCLLWSPVVDLITVDLLMTKAYTYATGVHSHRNYKTDYVSGQLLEWGFGLYVPEGMDFSGPWLSPLRHTFSTQVPIWIMAGEAEVLTDSIVHFANRMGMVKENRVRLHEVPNAPHDILMGSRAMGWTRQAEEAASDAIEFLNKNGGA